MTDPEMGMQGLRRFPLPRVSLDALIGIGAADAGSGLSQCNVLFERPDGGIYVRSAATKCSKPLLNVKRAGRCRIH
jgi:hypothetical protein